MIHLFEIHLESSESEAIQFALAESAKEIDAVCKLFFDVYKQKRYIDPKSFPDGVLKDEYDREGKCVYLAASIRGKIVAAVRLVQGRTLPIYQYYDFKKPEKLRKWDALDLCEISRLVVRRSLPDDPPIPKHLAVLGMIYGFFLVCGQKGIYGAYGFIKGSLLGRIEKLKVPTHRISPFIEKGGGVLAPYFNQRHNPAFPV